MNSGQSGLMSIFNTCYIVCLVLTIIFFLITILLFFLFDIRRVFMIRTGRAAKRDIKKLEEENFNTGRLSRYQSNTVYGESGSFAPSEEFGKTERIEDDPMLTGYQMSNNPSGANTYNADANSTTVLNNGETTVLSAGETTVLSNQGMNSMNKNRKFNVVLSQMLIHTEEII